MLSSTQLQQLGEAELRMLAQELMARLSNADSELQTKERKLVWSTPRIEQLTHEIAVLKRWKFSARSEQLDAAQKSLLDEEVDADIAAVAFELQALRSPPVCRTPAAVSGASARTPAAHRATPRAREHHLLLWLHAQALR